MDRSVVQLASSASPINNPFIFLYCLKNYIHAHHSFDFLYFYILNSINYSKVLNDDLHTEHRNYFMKKLFAFIGKTFLLEKIAWTCISNIHGKHFDQLMIIQSLEQLKLLMLTYISVLIVSDYLFIAQKSL